MNRWSALALLLALAGALALRLPHLDQRPLHNDEAVNAIKVSELWEHGRYAYDPDEYHGPTLHYATLPFLWLSSAKNSHELKDATLRLAPVLFGVALILLLPLFADGLGRHAMGWSAVFIAISPAFVFYSRYFIHEMLLIFFTALTLGAGWRYLQTRTVAWAITAGAGLGLMFATKETFVLTVAAMGMAVFVTAWVFLPRGERWVELRGALNGKHVALALGAMLVVWFVFFTSFFTNFAGPLDSVRTYLPWLKRAGGHSPHIQPWYFYFERLFWFHPRKSPVWSEALIMGLAIFGAVAALVRRRSMLPCFLVFFTFILTGIYTVISYKTPWCLLNFYFGMILLAGSGAAVLVEFFRPRVLRIAVALVLIGFAAQLAWQSWRANFFFPADSRNPYAYAQTLPDLLKLAERAEGIARMAPAGHDTVIKVVAPDSDYWPLPWYLRRFNHVGWYEKLPDDPFAPVMIVSSEFDARLDDKSERKWIMAGITQMRPGTFFELYVELELWKQFVETLPRDRE